MLVFEPGAVVDDRFVVEAVAGEGGMSRVYRALDRSTNERVALKVLDEIEETDRLVREAKLIASLRHPGFARYVAHGVSPWPFLVMEWLDGEDLESRLRREELEVPDSVELARRIADALAVAHRAGVVHRDVKPSNIFLEAGAIEGSKLLDFGVARLDAATRQLTRTGAVVGTVGYMSPEQARGQAAIDARADVFALGCVLFRCLTGRRPFEGENAGVITAKLLLAERPRVSDHIANVPHALDQLVDRMLALSPSDRPANGEHVALALSMVGPLPRERPRPAGEPKPIVRQREQLLVSLIFASQLDPGASDAAATAEAGTAVLPEVSRFERQAVTSTVAAHGGTIEVLGDRSMLVMISGPLVATDLAAQAGRCAIALRRVLPDWTLAIALGHRDSTTNMPTSASIDQVDSLLRSGSGAGRIVVEEAVANLLDARFELAKQPHAIDLIRARGTESGVRQLLGKPTPYVGREREQAVILATLEHAIADAMPSAVLVTAAPGLGKSRLCHELLHRVRDEGAAEVRIWKAQADALSRGSAFALLGSIVRDAASILGGEPTHVREDKLRACVARYVPEADVARVTEFLGEIADVHVAHPSAQLGAARQDAALMGDQLVRVWKDLVRGACAVHPLLIVLEDLHWGDHPSVRFVDAALRGAEQRLMVLALARPEVHDAFPRLWADRGMQEIRLAGLSRKACERLIRHTLGDVTPEIIAQLAERSDGNAFYLEELIRAVAEGKGDQLPESVLAMAEARFQRLEPTARKLLRTASIFGETFWRGAIEALMTPEEWASVAPMIDQLVDNEVVTPVRSSRISGESELVFRHALIRDAAYASLTASDRTAGHARAGEWLETHGERDSVVLAQHYELGGELAQARAHYKRAAELAFDGNDLESALARADMSIRCGAAGYVLGELQLLKAEIKGWHGKPAEQLPLATAALASLPPDVIHRFRAAEQLALASCRIANHEMVQKAAEILCALEPRSAVTSAHLWPLARAVNQLVLMGETAHVQRLIARMEQLRARIPDDEAALACTRFGRAFAALFDLEPEPYVRDFDEIVRAFEAVGYHRYAALQCFTVPYACAAIGAFDEGMQRARDALALCQRLELANYAAGAKSQIGWFLARLGELDEARRIANEALAYTVAVGQKLMEGNVRCRLASIYRMAGELDASEHEARTAAHLAGLAPTHRGDAHVRLASVLLAKGKHGEALDVSTQAMKLMFPAGTHSGSQGLAWLTHVDVLAANGRGDDSLRTLSDAKVWLQARVDRIVDPTRRSTFVAVPEHAEILSRSS